mmetsp:Transcript_9939/g.31923  ORF Transcript_9939/g.31923 Transcript_9939/m.31923 type:complete len:94 (+) Transcript_9939:504-785(+)
MIGQVGNGYDQLTRLRHKYFERGGTMRRGPSSLRLVFIILHKVEFVLVDLLFRCARIPLPSLAIDISSVPPPSSWMPRLWPHSSALEFVRRQD